jgi:uncharacterized protein with NRDE domain
LILFQFEPDSIEPLIVAANRDEFYARPALAAHYWQDHPRIFAGRDLTAGGTWLGVSRSGRFAALTNFSAGDAVADYPESRGALVADFLTTEVPAAEYVQNLQPERFAGFNLLAYDGTELHYATNKGFPSQKLAPGTYGLSNAELTSDWPKAVDGAADLARVLSAKAPNASTIPELLGVLSDATPPTDDRLPDRSHLSDMPIDTRRALAARFIAGDDYGTRAMTLVTVGRRQTDVFEQQLDSGGERGCAVYARVPRQGI